MKTGRKKPECDVTVTSVTSVTNVTNNINIKVWGYVDAKEQILLEQINSRIYIYNIKGNIGLIKVQSGRPFKKEAMADQKAILDKQEISPKEKQKELKQFEKEYDKANKPFHYIYIGDFLPNVLFKFEERDTYDAMYLKPTLSECSEFLKEKTTPDFKELFEELKSTISLLYDFEHKRDLVLVSLAIVCSWLTPVLDASFLLGIDATKGSGKTTLLEIIKTLSRHGFLAGDVSVASIPRLKHTQELSICIDELDEVPATQKEALEKLLRQANRRGNFYIRMNERNTAPEVFDAFGWYYYTYRKKVEDAFASRSVFVHASRSADKRLPILNYHKSDVLRPMFLKLFFWYVSEIFKNHEGSYTGYAVTQVTGLKDTVKKNRALLYANFLKPFSDSEKAVFEKLVGRNSEIAYTLFKACNRAGLELHDEISKMLDEKQESEDLGDSVYFDLLKEFLLIKLLKLQESEVWLLKKGKHEHCYYYPKTDVYTDFLEFLKWKQVMTIGHSSFAGLLKDIGFIDKKNVDVQKHPKTKGSVRCLIWDKTILKNIGYSSVKVIEEDVKDEGTIEEQLFSKIKSSEDELMCAGDCSDLLKRHGWNTEKIDNMFKLWLKEGVLFEPKPGFLKVLE